MRYPEPSITSALGQSSVLSRLPSPKTTSVIAFVALVSICGIGTNTYADDQPVQQSVQQPVQQKDSGLAAVQITDDEDRLHEALHGARLLAEAGAGYEAVRVIAAIAERVPDTGPGHDASEWLKELELTVDGVRDGNALAINAQVAKRLSNRRHDDEGHSIRANVWNLLELGLFEVAADKLMARSRGRTGENIESDWGELLRRCQIPLEALQKSENVASQEARNTIVAGFKQRYDRLQLRRQSAELWMVDHEAGELANALWESLSDHDRAARRENHERDDDERHDDDDHFGRYVERRHEEREREERDNEDRQRDEFDEREDVESQRNELATHALNRALRLAKRHPQAAITLGKLIVLAAPETLAATPAQALVTKLGDSSASNRKVQTPVRKPSGKDVGADMFSKLQLRSYQLKLSDDAIKRLREEPKEYVRATFVEGDAVYANVGVRLKGGWGSFRMLDGRAKAGFTIKFNQFDADQRFHGLRRIVLNNGVQDPTYLNEYIGYSVFRDAGIPAPRIGYATLSVNDEDYGLYVQVEAVTQDFLDRWFEKTNGNLYEGPGDVVDWRELDLDSNQAKENRQDLRMLARAIERADDDDPWPAISEHVNLDGFTRFLVCEQLLGHWDGYTQTNNYRIYHDPTTNKFEFFPHGCDQLFEEPGQDIIHRQGGILGRAMTLTDSGEQRFRATMQRVLDEVWDEDKLKRRVAEAYTMIQPVVHARPGKRPHDPHEFEDRVSATLRFLSLRRYAAQSQLNRRDKPSSWRERQHEGEGHLPSFFYHEREW